MSRNPILDVPLTSVMRSEIALPLQHVLHLPNIGCLLRAWRNPRTQKSIEDVFDSPEQARHAVAVCAAWLGVQPAPSPGMVAPWWHHDERPAADA